MAEEKPGGQQRRGPSTKTKVVFMLVIIIFFFGTAELVARALGLGDPEAFGGSRLLYQHIYPPLLVQTPKGVWRPRDPRLVDRPTPLHAPPTRIFTFGESAVAGLGMSENASFSRALERDLRACGDDSTVTNIGIVALDSRQVYACVKDCCKRQKPEVVVLHVGNNEFLEPHAMKWVVAKGEPVGMKLDRIFSCSRLFLALKNKAEEARTAVLTTQTFSTQSLRLSEHQLVKEKGVSISKEEIAAAVAKHLANMKKTIELAKASGAKVILMTVATNLEWSGSEDPKGGWLAKACGKPVPEKGPERTDILRAAQDALTKTVTGEDGAEPRPSTSAAKDALDRWEALYERAVVRRALGDTKGARDDFQKANDEDPHLRRCLSVMNDNMRQLAKDEGVTLVDGAKVLAAASTDGITGFEMLYDYVHFKPAGSERLAAALAQALLGDAKAEQLAKHVADRDALLASRKTDALEVQEYLGWNDDRSMLSSQDLWKYEKGRDALEAKIAAGNATPEELVWAADGHALVVGEEKRARELYALAKQRKPELASVIDANLKWLDSR